MPATTNALVGLTQRLEESNALDGLRGVYAVLAGARRPLVGQ